MFILSGVKQVEIIAIESLRKLLCVWRYNCVREEG